MNDGDTLSAVVEEELEWMDLFQVMSRTFRLNVKVVCGSFGIESNGGEWGLNHPSVQRIRTAHLNVFGHSDEIDYADTADDLILAVRDTCLKLDVIRTYINDVIRRWDDGGPRELLDDTLRRCHDGK